MRVDPSVGSTIGGVRTSANVKETIQRVALDMFSAKGYYGVSIRDIAAESNCSIPMVYY